MWPTLEPQKRVHRYSGLPDLTLGCDASRVLTKEHLIYALQLALEHLVTRDELRTWAASSGGYVDGSAPMVGQIIWELGDGTDRGQDVDFALLQACLNDLMQGNSDGSKPSP